MARKQDNTLLYVGLGGLAIYLLSRDKSGTGGSSAKETEPIVEAGGAAAEEAEVIVQPEVTKAQADVHDALEDAQDATTKAEIEIARQEAIQAAKEAFEALEAIKKHPEVKKSINWKDILGGIADIAAQIPKIILALKANHVPEDDMPTFPDYAWDIEPILNGSAPRSLDGRPSQLPALD